MTPTAMGILSEVRFELDIEDCPTGWNVRRFHLAEGLSEPYQLTLELVSSDIYAPVQALLGATCRLVIARDLTFRAVYGLVHRVETTGLTGDHIGVRLDLISAAGLLAQVVNTRFWQNKSVVDILKDVMERPLRDLGRTLRFDLDESAYEPREYCVQFRESDFDFACRLMQEEGILYYFEHPLDEGAEVLVLVGASADCPELTLADELTALPLVPESTGTRLSESIHHFGWASILRSTSVVQRDFDWVNPPDSPYSRERRGEDARGRDREVYAHDDRRLLSDDGERLARRKLEAITTSGEIGRGQSDVVGVLPGHRFPLIGHPQPDLDRVYLLTRVVHTGDAPDASPFAQGAGGGPRYVNTFECIPDDRPFQTQRVIPKPRVQGPQTAIVVGPEGEEIHTDQHGRIKVLFHWDRLSPRDDTASCWIRVTQKWAGPGWGFMFLPRIGMEVLVEFLDGDPDRPVVTGCIYNGLNEPPYPLPDEKTKSTIKSESSLGAGGSNEIRFEDAKGSEEIFIHAQKDMNEVVENDNSRSVKGSQSFSISGSQSFSVGGSQSFSVTGDRSLTVSEGNETTTISAGTSTTTVQGDRSTTVTSGNDTLTVSSGSHTSTVTQAVKIESVSAGIELLSSQEASMTSSAADISLTGENNASLTAKTATLSLQGHTDVTLSSETTKVEIGAPSQITLSTPLALDASGKTVSISGTERITLSVGSSSLTITPAGITISSPKITSAAVGIHEISGALIKIN